MPDKNSTGRLDSACLAHPVEQERLTRLSAPNNESKYLRCIWPTRLSSPGAMAACDFSIS